MFEEGRKTGSLQCDCCALLNCTHPHTNGCHKLSEMVRAIPIFLPLSLQTFCETFCKNFPPENIGFSLVLPQLLGFRQEKFPSVVIYGHATGGHVTPEYEKLFSYIGFLRTLPSDIHYIHVWWNKNLIKRISFDIYLFLYHIRRTPKVYTIILFLTSPTIYVFMPRQFAKKLFLFISQHNLPKTTSYIYIPFWNTGGGTCSTSKNRKYKEEIQNTIGNTKYK